MTNTHSFLPDELPEGHEDIILKEEVNYEIIFETGQSVWLNLYIRPHADYPDMVPDDARECRHHDAPTVEPSTLSDLPVRFQQHFQDRARVVQEKYDLEPAGEEAVCTFCMPMRDDCILQFNQRFE